MSRINAAPRVDDYGIKADIPPVLSNQGLKQPQHIPKVYIFAEKGKTGDQFIDLANTDLVQLYGEKTFDVTDKYYSHSTPFAELFAKNANNFVVHKVPGQNAKDVANLALYLDILETNVPIYVKNSDGSLKLDNNGQPTKQLNSNGDPILLPGYNVCWTVASVSVPLGTYQRGSLSQGNGIQVTQAGVQSKRYPIFEFMASSAGEFGKRLGVNLFAAVTTDMMPFDESLLETDKQYPMYFRFIKKVDETTGKTSAVLNNLGSEVSKFSVKSDGYNSAIGAYCGLERVIKNEWIGTDSATDSGLGGVYIYQNNLKEVLGLLYEKEKNISDAHRDGVINNSESNLFALNVFSFTSSNGSPYQTIKVVDAPGSTRLTKNTVLYMSGADDGIMTADYLDTYVAQDMENYGNLLHEYQDMVLHPENIIYDTGFSLDTKKSLYKFISRRRDTIVANSTFLHSNENLSVSEQMSIGVALKTYANLYPESSQFGTSVARGIIAVGSGELINSTYINRVPTLYDIADKASKYMGASNGAWKNRLIFDSAPGSIVTTLTNIDITWIPVDTRKTMWSTGLSFVLNYENNSQYWPGIQTVYEEDRSVLNSFFTIMAISYLNKINHAAHREFSGNISLTDAQLEQKVNEFVSKNVKDKFDNNFVIVPAATITAYDSELGFSWTLPVKIYANNMRTVMTTYIEAHRMTDLAST